MTQSSDKLAGAVGNLEAILLRAEVKTTKSHPRHRCWSRCLVRLGGSDQGRQLPFIS